MATRKNKYAGRCEICRKWVTWDDFQVVHDMTIVALRPAYELAQEKHGPNCTCNNEELDEMVSSLLGGSPICSSCWHKTNDAHNLAEGALGIIKAGVVVAPGAQFVWQVVAK
jgi:hypothetical protein